MSTIKPEITIASDWGELLSAGDPNDSISCPLLVNVKPLLPGVEIILLEHVFSPAECSILIAEAEKHGFGYTEYRKSYRGNLRLMTTDYSLAAIVWERIKGLVPDRLVLNNHEYAAVGLNEMWRLAKYFPGDRFCKHCDASFEDKERQIESMFTVNIYMNGGFEGGETSFYLDGGQHDVAPESGLCLIFRQPPGRSYRHEGQELRSGLKYLFRSDIMYRKVDVSVGVDLSL
jgi:prolyl 4-hydroxylase